MTEPSIEEIERQIRFELRAIEEASRKVRENIRQNGLAGSPVSMKITKRLIKPLVETIETDRATAVETLNANGRKKFLWIVPMCSVEAHKLAVIILTCLFRTKKREGSSGVPISRLARNISETTAQQLQFDQWEADQKALKKEEGGFTDLDRLRSSIKVVDEKSWGRFKANIDVARLEQWDHSTGIHFGAKCIDVLAKAAPHWFEVATVNIGRGLHEAQVVMTDECQEAIIKMVEDQGIAGPRLLPMLCPPAPWRRVD